MKIIATVALAIALLCTPAMAQTNPGSSPLSGAKGGTNNSFMQFTGPATSMKTFTLPNVSDTIATISSGQTLTNKTLNCANNTCTIRIASDVTGLGTGVATFLTTPSSANLRAALTDEVGTGAAYFVGGALGTPASGTLTNATGLPPGGLAAQAAYTFIGNNSGSSAVPSAVDIAALTTKASPAAGDYVMLSDQAASGAWKKAAVSSIASAGSVSSIAGNTGAFTLSKGITNATNDIQLSLTNATVQAAPSIANIGSGGPVMGGIGGSCKITPAYSGRVRFSISGLFSNSSTATVTTTTPRYGTGTAPTFASGAAGTTPTVGTLAINHVTANANLFFGFNFIVTGLTPSTQYWFDLALTISAGTLATAGLSCNAEEF